MKLDRNDVFDLLKSNKNKIFSVIFLKRTTGEVRHMTCRLNVAKHLNGGMLLFDPLSRGLISVYDVKNKGYRMINLETLMSIKMLGRSYDLA